MTPYLRCDNVRLARFLMSNPPPANARKGTMLLVYGERALAWPMVAAGYDDGKLEAA